MQRIRKLTVLAAATLAAVTLLPDTAQAKRKSPLEGKPVVVRKLELRKLRFGITPFVGMSLSQTFVHKGYVGGRLHFDFTDWIGIQAKFAYGIINRDAKLLRALTAARLASVEDTTRPVTLAGCGPALDSLLELTGLAGAFERTD